MRHLIPSLCLALFLAETACSAPNAVKRNDSDVRQKNAATRQRAESAYNELDGFGTATTAKAVNTTPTAFNASAPAQAVSNKAAAATEAATETYANTSAIQDIGTPVIMVSPTLSMKDGVPDLSSVNRFQEGRASQERRLTRSGGADNAHDLTAVHAKANVLKHLESIELLPDVVHLQDHARPPLLVVVHGLLDAFHYECDHIVGNEVEDARNDKRGEGRLRCRNLLCKAEYLSICQAEGK